MSYEIDRRFETIKNMDIEPSEQLVRRTKLLAKAARSQKKVMNGRIPLIASACLASVSIIFALIAILSFNAPRTILTEETAAIYSLDINPSIELGVDIKKEVIQVKSLNEEGKLLLKQVNCMGSQIYDCIDELIGKAAELGYISEDSSSYIVVSEVLVDDGFISIKDDIETMETPDSVKVIFLAGEIENKENADIKGISIGREIFWERARELGIEITEKELAQKSIKELIDSASQDAGMIFDDEEDYALPAVYAESREGYIAVSWDKIEDERLLGYKVVISSGNETPEYPDDGYLVYITDKGQTSIDIDGGMGYIGGDFGGHLEDGMSYYINITAVYEDRYLSGSAVYARFDADTDETAGPCCEPCMIYGERLADGTIRLSWDRACDEGFQGYKIVASATDSTPCYPEDGYIGYVTDIDVTSIIIDEDFGRKLEQGKEYFFSITASYSGRYAAGNSVKLKYMDAEEAPSGTSSDITGKRLENGDIYLEWEQAEGDGFKGYKVVASSDDPTPTYPENGYIAYITDRTMTVLLIDESYSNKLAYGTEYYFSITVLYDDGKESGNSVKLRYKDTQAEGTLEQSMITGQRLEDGTIQLSWEKIDDPCFSGYKVVASATNPEPSYPQDGYIKYITDKNTTTLLVDASFSSKLIPGTEYYFSVTVLYGDKKVPGNSVKIKYMDTVTDAERPPSQISGERCEDGSILLTWEEITVPGFDGYKIVASETDQYPSYPENGYISWITDGSRTSLLIDDSFGSKLTPGKSYYFSVTVIYDGHSVKVPGNSVYIKYK